MKKLALIACLSTSMFISMSAQARWETNWLIGLSGGYASHGPDLEHTFIQLVPGNAPQYAAYHNDFDANDWIWGALGGYQAKCNKLLLGVELNVDWEKRSTQNFGYGDISFIPDYAVNGAVRYKRRSTIGLTGRLGYQALCWLMPYVRLGVETGRDRLEVFMRAYQIGDFYKYDTSERSYRFVSGLGLEMPIAQCTGLTVRAEYNYITKNEALYLDRSWSNPQLDSIFKLSNNHTNRVMASFVYNFNF
jgi:opacity protein-like surface antigen